MAAYLDPAGFTSWAVASGVVREESPAGPVSLVDNGDGTATLAVVGSASLVDGGDGTATLNGPGVYVWADDGSPFVPVPDRTIRRATLPVLAYLSTVVYATNADGTPSDPSVASAVADAVAEQVLQVVSAERRVANATALSPLGRPLASASIEGASYTADQNYPVDLPDDGTLTREAYDVLWAAGLRPTIWVTG